MARQQAPIRFQWKALKVHVDLEMLAEMLYRLFEKIWEEEIPSEWKEGLLMKIPKKGDLGLCSNYRGITVPSMPGKVLNTVIMERLKGPINLSLRIISKLPSGQAGHVLIRSQHYEFYWNNQLNWCYPLYENLLATRRLSTASTGRYYGSCFDIMVYP